MRRESVDYELECRINTENGVKALKENENIDLQMY